MSETATQIKRRQIAAKGKGTTQAEAGAKRRGVLERWRAGEVEPDKLKRYDLPFWPIKVAAVGIDQGSDVSTAVLVATDFITLKGNQVEAGLHRAETQLAGLEQGHRLTLALRALEHFETDPESWDLTNEELEAARAEVAQWEELRGVVAEATRLATEVLTDGLAAEAYAAKLARGWTKVVGYTPKDSTRIGTADARYRDAEAAIEPVHQAYLVHLRANAGARLDRRLEKQLREMFSEAGERLKAREEVGPMPTAAAATAIIDHGKNQTAERQAEAMKAKAEKRERIKAEAALMAQARNPQREEG